jgi:Fe-S-cluster containining protein
MANSPIDPRRHAARPSDKRRPLPVPESALAIHSKIVSRIKELQALAVKTPLAPAFGGGYHGVMMLFEGFQKEVIEHSGYRMSCSKGCTRCCLHWVEDVYSFEAEIAADHVRTNLPQRVDTIVGQFRRDIAEMERLDVIVAEKLKGLPVEEGRDTIDPVDLLLASFYQLRRPCAFLTDGGECSIYPVRPLSCRIYVSFSDPIYCDPDYINVSDMRTYHLDLQEDASELLDRLHVRFDRFGGDMGLRSLMVKFLTEKP